MILKMRHHETQNWVIVDNVRSISVMSDYALHYTENCKLEAIRKEYKDQEGKFHSLFTPKQKGWEIVKSNELIGIDFFLLDEDKWDFEGDSFKNQHFNIVCVNWFVKDEIEPSTHTYMIPKECEIYLLNDEGKTIEKIS